MRQACVVGLALLTALGAAPVIAADSQDSATEAAAPPLTVGYRTPTHPQYQRIYDNMASSDLLRKSIEPLVTVLPAIKPFNVELLECGSETMDFVAAERTLRVCYEALTVVVTSGRGLSTDATARARIPGSVAAYALFRSVFRIYVAEGVIPAPAANSDVTDEFFALAMSTTDKYSDMMHDVSLWLDASAPRSDRRPPKGVIGSLGLTSRSPRSFACVAVGSNPTTFGDLSVRYKMTPEQIDDCRDSWLEVHQRFSQLLAAIDSRDTGRLDECVNLFQSKRLDDANMCFTALIDAQSPAPRGAALANLLARRAIVLVNFENKDDEVRQDVARARSLNPREPLTYSAECELARRQRNWKAMEDAATRGLAVLPDTDMLKVLRATARSMLHDRVGAADDVRDVAFTSPDLRNNFVANGLLAAPGTRVPRELSVSLTTGKSAGSLLIKQGDNVVIKNIGASDSYAGEVLNLMGSHCTAGEGGVRQNGFGSAYGAIVCDGKMRYFGDVTIEDRKTRPAIPPQ